MDSIIRQMGIVANSTRETSKNIGESLKNIFSQYQNNILNKNNTY